MSKKQCPVCDNSIPADVFPCHVCDWDNSPVVGEGGLRQLESELEQARRQWKEDQTSVDTINLVDTSSWAGAVFGLIFVSLIIFFASNNIQDVLVLFVGLILWIGLTIGLEYVNEIDSWKVKVFALIYGAVSLGCLFLLENQNLGSELSDVVKGLSMVFLIVSLSGSVLAFLGMGRK